MNAKEIVDFINKKIPYEYTNGRYLWSNWHDFKPESLPQMLEIQQMKGLDFELQIRDKKFRIWYCLL